jgi:hypothetical protein
VVTSARRWTGISLALLLAASGTVAMDASAAGNPTVGVGGAAPSQDSYSGSVVGPSNPDPLGPPSPGPCDPTAGCQRQAVNVEMPAAWTSNHTVTFTVALHYPNGGGGDLDVGILDSKGNLLASAFAVGEGQVVAASGVSRGTYTVEVDSDIAAGPEDYVAKLGASSGPKYVPPSRKVGALSFSRPTLTDPYRLGTEPNIAVAPSGNLMYESPIFGFSTTQSFLERTTNGGRTWNTLGLPGVGKLDQCTGGGDSDLSTDPYEGDIYMIDLGGAPEVPARVSNNKGLSFASSCEANFHDGANYFTDRQWLSTDKKHHVEWYIYRDGVIDTNTAPGVGGTDIGKQGYGEFLKYAPLASGPGKAGSNQLNFTSLCKIQGAGATPCFGDLSIAGNAISDNGKNSPRYGTTYLAMDRAQGISVAAFDTSGPKSVKEYTAVANHHPVLFPTVAVDTAGTVYMTYTDDRNYQVYETHTVGRLSSTQCSSTVTTACWTKPIAVNGGKVATTVMPWVVAGSKGRIDVVFYGTDVTKAPTINYGPWYPYLDQSINATSAKPTWHQARMTDRPNHIEPVCLSGLGCTTNTGPGGDRELGDFFKVALDNKGRAVVSFADGDNQLGREVVGGPAAAPSFADFVKQSTGPSAYKSVGDLRRIATPTECSKIGKHHDPVPFDVPGAGAQGPDVAALKLQQSCVRRMSNGNLKVTLTLSKLDMQAAVTPPAEPNSTFLVRWVYHNKVFFAAAEDNAGQLRYFSGQGAPVSDGLAIKYAYYPASGPATGSVDAQSKTVTVNVPAKAVGNPPLGAHLSTVTAYSITQPAPSAPTPPNASNYTVDEQVVDSLPAYSVYLGGKKYEPGGVAPVALPGGNDRPVLLPIVALLLLLGSVASAGAAARARRRPVARPVRVALA